MQEPRLGECAALGVAPEPILHLRLDGGTIRTSVGQVRLDGPLYENGDFELKGAIWSPDGGTTSLRCQGRLRERDHRRLEGRYSQVANRHSEDGPRRCSESWEFVGTPL